MICKKCQKDKTHCARGLCSRCYELERVSGNLEQYTDHRRKNGLTKTICKQCGAGFESYPTNFGPRQYCSRPCYELSERVTTEKDNGRIIELHLNGLSASKIALEFNVSNATIVNVLERNGYSARPGWSYARKYSTNEFAFDDLDNEQSAYWLGFIYADGHIGKSGLQISLKSSDSYHLDKLAIFLNSNCPSRPAKNRDTHYISFCGIHISKALNDLGIISRRGEFYRVLEKLPIEQYRHFIRGYLDGDGYITKLGSSNCNVGFVGQDDILIWIKQVLVDNCQSKNPNIRQRRGIGEICFGGKNQVSLILEWLYRDATIYLIRKHDRAIYWMTK